MLSFKLYFIPGNPINLFFNKINRTFIKCSSEKGFWWYNCVAINVHSHFPTGPQQIYMGGKFLNQVKISLRNGMFKHS